MKNIKLHGMKSLCSDLSAAYNNRGYHTEIHLDRATGKIWGKMIGDHSWTVYPDHSSCVCTTVGALREHDMLVNRYEWDGLKDRNDAIREWANKQIADYNA